MANRLDASGYETDKALHPHYLRSYEQYFDRLQDKEVRLLELGVYKGRYCFGATTSGKV